MTIDEHLISDLMHRSIDDLHAHPGTAARLTARVRRQRRRRNAATAVLGAGAAAAVVSATVASGGSARPASAHVAAPSQPAAAHRPGNRTILYRLASASAAATPTTGKYVVQSVTDMSTIPGRSGSSDVDVTTVIDAADGSSVTYQHGTAEMGPAPTPVIDSGPYAEDTRAYFAALSTDPTVLAGQLLAMGQAQQAAGMSEGESDEGMTYSMATYLLWSPLVSPELRSATYQVIAGLPGVQIDPTATDPAGQSSISMALTYGIGGSQDEIDTTWEDPATGAVLAQEYAAGKDDVQIFHSVTSADTIPADPYTAGASGTTGTSGT